MPHALPTWATELLESLEIQPVNVNIDTLDKICQDLTDDPHRDRILVGFIAGYAAGLAEGGGMADFDRAHAASLQFMHKHLVGE